MDIESTQRFLIDKKEIDEAVKDYLVKKFAENNQPNHFLSEETRIQYDVSDGEDGYADFDTLTVMLTTKNEFKGR